MNKFSIFLSTLICLFVACCPTQNYTKLLSAINNEQNISKKLLFCTIHNNKLKKYNDYYAHYTDTLISKNYNILYLGAYDYKQKHEIDVCIIYDKVAHKDAGFFAVPINSFRVDNSNQAVITEYVFAETGSVGVNDDCFYLPIEKLKKPFKVDTLNHKYSWKEGGEYSIDTLHFCIKPTTHLTHKATH